MSDEIKVKVTRHGKRKFLQMYYDDPITGEREQRSIKKTTRRDAERAAAKWEAELREGRYRRDSRITWEAFRQRYEDEKLASLAPGTAQAAATVFNHVEQLIAPKFLASMTPAMLSRFQAELRKTGIAETSIAGDLGHLRSALNWAFEMGLLPTRPKIEMPKQAKGRTLMRGRPITGEEFERMLTAVPKVRPTDADAWVHYLRGLWLSGLRLEESLVVSWDQDEPFAIDLTGRHPAIRIYAASQKSRKDELWPVPPDFAEFILRTPEDQRHGRVFKIDGLKTKKPITPKRVCRIVSDIGELAGVVVNKDEGKFASAHDFRRAFGTRWASRVKPPVLQRLMRHQNIQTTLKYYVALDADDIADELWAKHPAVDTSVGTHQNPPHGKSPAMPTQTKKPVARQRVKEGGGHGSRTRNPLRGTTSPMWPLTIRIPSGLLTRF
jgi:integrase